MSLPPKIFGAGGILFSGVSVCEWVCASWKPCEHHISKKWREFHPNLVKDVFWFIDVLIIRFLGQKVKRPGHNRQKRNRRWQPFEFHLF